MKAPLILLSSFMAFLASCSCPCFQPKTTANGEAARVNCLALTKHHEEIDQRLSPKSAAPKAATSNPSNLVAIEVRMFESDHPESAEPKQAAQVLSESETKQKVEKLKSEGRAVSYPRMLTKSGRSAVFKSVINQPVLASSSSEAPGEEGVVESTTVEYVPIGIVVGANPTILTNDRIHLDLDLTHSNIIGEERIDGNPYPVVASQFHTGGYELSEGESVLLEMEPAKGENTASLLLVTATFVPTPEDFQQ